MLILLVHNFAVSLVSTIADITNIVIKHFAVVTPHDNDSIFQVIITASSAEHNAAVPNKNFVAYIVVKYLINEDFYQQCSQGQQE